LNISREKEAQEQNIFRLNAAFFKLTVYAKTGMIYAAKFTIRLGTINVKQGLLDEFFSQDL
jgi:hypothetical protein